MPHDQLQATRPTLSTREAAELAQSFYGLSGTVSSLPSERDQNFLVDSRDESQWVLKVSNSAETVETLEFQIQMMVHLREHCPAVKVPEVRPSTLGNTIEKTDTATPHWVRLVSYLPGTPLVHVRPHSPALLQDIGRQLGSLGRAMQSFDHPAKTRELKWDMLRAAPVIEQCSASIQEQQVAHQVDRIHQRWIDQVQPRVAEFRRSVVHNDANDYNVLVDDRVDGQNMCGLIDFGDALFSATIADLAIACTYSMLDTRDPIGAAAAVIAGYHQQLAIVPDEIEVLLDLIQMRLAASLSIAASQHAANPSNEYLLVSTQPARRLLSQLFNMPSQLAISTFRAACGWTPYVKHHALSSWLARQRFGEVIDAARDDWKLVDFGVDSPLIPELERLHEVQQQADFLFSRLRADPVQLGVGRYCEPRLVYQADQFSSDSGSPRTVHLGVDLFAPAGTAVFSPWRGRVHSVSHNSLPLDYGPTIILEHEYDQGNFFTLYGHLSLESLDDLAAGNLIEKGQQIATLGAPQVNGGWIPHLHFQIIGDLLGKVGDFPGVAPADAWEVWSSLCPDPNLILNLDGLTPPDIDTGKIRRQRASTGSEALSLSYASPLHIVKGQGQYLYDVLGNRYLDCVNNVAHVGHCNRRVVDAAARQSAVLNTNTRYLNRQYTDYVTQLLERFPKHLEVCFLTCSGSEANELAVRLARRHTSGSEFVVLNHAYHGNSSTLIDLSPYKFQAPGGEGPGPHTHVLSLPVSTLESADMQSFVSQEMQAIEATMAARGEHLAALLAESIPSCAGQVVLPPSYLQSAYAEARRLGAVCIADEVQTGFGRVGSHFWAFETCGLLPDIVTLGKPIGNGYPLGAVVTTREIADSFATGVEYFNTFGGNPVSCAVGRAVLEVIEERQLQAHAQTTGEYFIENLRKIQKEHPAIVDVRGRGLFLGIEIRPPQVVSDSRCVTAAAIATYLVEQMKIRGVLLSTDGPSHDVIKIKPPLVFDRENVDTVCRGLSSVLGHSCIRSLYQT